MNSYEHRQWGPWAPLLYLLGSGALTLAWFLQREPPAPYILLGVGMIFLVLAPCFHYLNVADEGDSLAISFGPLPLFHQRIRYGDIQNVEPGRTMLIEGWGVHMSMLRRGWVWNIWGWDCVVIHHSGILRLGTNDSANLLGFLKSRIRTDI